MLIPMISLKRMHVSSTTGHAVNFDASPKGVADPHITNVPKAMVPECLARGAVVFESEDQPFIDDDAGKIKAGFAGNLRDSLIYLVFQRIANENNPKNFNSGGQPRPEVVSQILTFDVSAKEIKTLYQKFLSAQKSGDELKIDARAQKALDVIDALSLDELKMIAQEMNVKDTETAGLSSRDLKQLLLSKYAS